MQSLEQKKMQKGGGGVGGGLEGGGGEGAGSEEGDGLSDGLCISADINIEKHISAEPYQLMPQRKSVMVADIEHSLNALGVKKNIQKKKSSVMYAGMCGRVIIYIYDIYVYMYICIYIYIYT